MAINEWSTTAASNASGVTGVNWAEGQAPSTVNDSARAMMADVATWYGQASGKIPEYLTSTAGTNTITATGPTAMSAYAAGQRFTFIPAATNTGATTLNITPSGGSALGAKNVFANGVACSGGELKINVPTSVLYDGTQFNIFGSGSASTGSSWVLLNTATASSSSSLDWSSTYITSSYDHYVLQLVDLLIATDAQDLCLRISQDGGSTFKSGASDYSRAVLACNDGSGTGSLSGLGTRIQLNVAAMSNGTAGWSGLIHFFRPSGTTLRHSAVFHGQFRATTPGMEMVTGAGSYVIDTAAVNGLRLVSTSGNLASGYVNLYGVRKS